MCLYADNVVDVRDVQRSECCDVVRSVDGLLQ